MNKELYRLLELSGMKPKNYVVEELYEAYAVNDKVDSDEYPEIRGMEGPFKMKNGRIVYYDPKEGKYYDRKTDIYLDDKEATSLHEDADFNYGHILFATKGDETLKLKLETVSEIKPMVNSLVINGFDKFSYIGSDNKKLPLTTDTMDDILNPVEETEKLEERELTDKEEENLEKLKDKYEDSDMYVSMIDQYGPEKGKEVFYAKLTKWAKKGKNLNESTLTEDSLSKKEKENLEKLKKKYEDSEMYADMIKEYGAEKGEEVFYATLTKWAQQGKNINEDYEAVDATVFDNENSPHNAVDDMAKKAERTGLADRVETEMKTPKDVMASLNRRIKEIKQAIDMFDEKRYDDRSSKGEALEVLEKVKEHLEGKTYQDFMQAQMYVNTLMSNIKDMLPANVIKYLAKGYSEEE